MGFTHFDEKGKAIMVDVTEKQDTVREATATGKITVNEEVFRAVKEGTAGKSATLAPVRASISTPVFPVTRTVQLQ